LNDLLARIKLKEVEISKQIMQYLKLFGYAYRINTVGIYDQAKHVYRSTHSSRGIPDIYFMSKKFGVIWFEVKSTKGKLNYHQKVFKTLCFDCEVQHHVVRSLDDVMEIVK